MRICENLDLVENQCLLIAVYHIVTVGTNSMVLINKVALRRDRWVPRW